MIVVCSNHKENPFYTNSITLLKCPFCGQELRVKTLPSKIEIKDEENKTVNPGKDSE